MEIQKEKAFKSCLENHKAVELMLVANIILKKVYIINKQEIYEKKQLIYKDQENKRQLKTKMK